MNPKDDALRDDSLAGFDAQRREMRRAERAWAELLEGLLDGSLCHRRRAEIDECIAARPELLDDYLDGIELHVLLSWEQGVLHGGAISFDAAPLPSTPRPAGGDGSDNALAVGAAAPQRASRRSGDALRQSRMFSYISGAAAVVLLLATMAYFRAPQRDRRPAAGLESAVARFTAAVNCQWEGNALARGAALSPGQEIELREGVAQVTFDSGAVVFIEGPVNFSPLDRNSASLRRGKLVARVGENAAGFAVEAPGVRVVDLGTEFGLKVDEEGIVDLHVFDGRVAAFHQPSEQPQPSRQPNDEKPNGEKRYDLTAGERLQFRGSEEPERSAIDPAERGEFARTLPPLPPGAEIGGLVHHWTFNDGTARDLVGTAHGELVGRARIEDGRLLLNGVDAFVRTEFSEHELTARTLVVWVRPENLEQRGGGVFTMQTRRDLHAFDGVVYGEKIPGQWMNGSDYFSRTVDDNGGRAETDAGTRAIAICYDRAGGIAIYRDGKRYVRTAQASKGEPAVYPARATRFLFGLRYEAAGEKTGEGGAEGGYFSGSIDEARVYDRVLASGEILALHLKGPVPLSKEDR